MFELQKLYTFVFCLFFSHAVSKATSMSLHLNNEL